MVDIKSTAANSKGNRTRPSFATKADAQAALVEITRQQHAGMHSADASKIRFAEAVEAWRAYERGRYARDEIGLARLELCDSLSKNHLIPDLGDVMLSVFEETQMHVVQEWLQGKQRAGYAQNTVDGLRIAVSLVLDAAVRAPHKWLIRNPMKDHRVLVPEIEQEERSVLQFDEIDRMICASLKRDDSGEELTHRVRLVFNLLGLLAAFRNQECTGLFWDCVKLDDRMLLVRRSYKRGKGVVKLTKTGKSGFRDVPMSPLLHAVLSAHRDRLLEFGHPTVGPVPVLVTARAEFVTPTAISRDHWSLIAKKAGFIDETTGANKHTFYSLRHTACSMWRAAGIDLDDLQRLMGHTTIQTTSKVYLHLVPHLYDLRREIPELIAALGLDRTPEGVIEALGIWFARRWAEHGLNVPCSPPRSATPPLRLVQAPDQEALPPPNIITLRPDEFRIELAAQQVDDLRDTLEALRARQRARCKQLDAEGWSWHRIRKEVGVSLSVLSDWLRGRDDKLDTRKVSASERCGLVKRCRHLHEQGKTSREISQATGVSPGMICSWGRTYGWPIPREHTQPKRRRHESRCRELFAQGITMTAIARELGVSETSVRTWLCDARLYDPQQFQAARAAQKVQASVLFAQGISKAEIARQLGFSWGAVHRWLSESRGDGQSPAELGTDLARDAESDAAD